MELKHKKEKLAALDNEVIKFHPLLHSLFEKLSDITKVEYSHGTDEKGADFVLCRQNKTIAENEYIGVIAKVGKIHQDFTDIERQIEECELPRYISNGKQEIYLHEIWVVSNENITRNAKDKINYKYRTRKIHFIDSARLIPLIDEHIPNYWYEFSIKVGEYLNKLWSQNEELDKNLNLLASCTKKIYIEQDIVEVDSDYNTSTKNKHKVHKTKSIKIYDEIKTKKVIIVEGGMGTGKSKLLRQLVSHYAQGDVFLENNILPVPTTYSELIDVYKGDIRKLIDSKVGEKALSELTDEDQVLLLIDAVDEKKMDIDESLSSLSEVVKNIHDMPNIKAVITSRFLSPLDKKQNLVKLAVRYELKYLNTKRIIDFLTKLCKEINITNRIVEDIKKSSLFRELPKSPIAAILLANLINDNSKDLPSNMTELYTKYLDYMLGRWDIEKGLQSQKEYEAADNSLMRLSKYLIDNQLIHISAEEALSFFSNYLRERNLDIVAEVLFNKVIERSGVLVKELPTNRVYFKHRTFSEYYYAKLMTKERTLEVDNRAFDLYWMNVFFFYVGLQRDCPQLLGEIMDVVPNSEAQRWLRIVNMANYFLAGFASPYKVITENLHRLMLEAAKLYKEICDEKIESPFAHFSVIHLLWLTQAIIRESYSFDFFKKAIDDANLLINEEPDSETKIYAFFFVAVIALELKVENPFDFLLDRHSKELPMPLRFALSYEGKDMKRHSHILKRQIKKLRDHLKESQKTRMYANILHDRPISLKKIT